jgi:hypothetical protein
MNILSFKTERIYKSIYDSDQNKREIGVYQFNNCTITGHNLYYPNILLKTSQTTLILPLLEKTMSLNSGTIYEKNGMKYKDPLMIETNNCAVYKNPVFFFVYNTDNYFHFLYDSLPYLISYLNLKKDIPHLKLLMQYPNEQMTSFYRFVTEFLEILNILKDDVIIIETNIIYKEIYVSTSYTHDIDSNLPPRQEIYDFYKNIVKIVKQKYCHINTPKKIYISRRTWIHNDLSNIGTNYTTRRRLVNEDELVIQLQEKGYIEVFTEGLTTVEKIMYFANATHVVGAIGGGISNVLFSRKETQLEVLVSPTFLGINSRFKYSLAGVDVCYNNNSEHVEKTDFKTYMRVKTKDEKIIGEIEKIYKSTVLVSYTDGSNTGWNAQNTYKQIELQIADIEKIDNGLNSPWKIIFE